MPFFSLRRDAFPAVVSLLPLLLAGDIELTQGPNCLTCRKPIHREMGYPQCQASSCRNGSHKQRLCSGFHRLQLTNSWRSPPHVVPGPPHRAPATLVTCDSCQQPISAADPSHVPPPTVHSAKRSTEVVGTVQQVHYSWRRWLRRGLEFHECKYASG